MAGQHRRWRATAVLSVGSTYIGGFQAANLSMKSHILHSVRENVHNNVTQEVW